MMSFCLVLSAGSCALPAGDFCSIAKPDVYASDEVASFMVSNDPNHVRLDVSENEYGEKHCAWGKVPSSGE